MGKRGNENSQMSREDYDAMQQDTARPTGQATSGTFQRASADVISNRKIRKIRRPNTSVNGGTERKNPFGGVSFGGGVGFQGFGGGQKSTGAATATGAAVSTSQTVGGGVAVGAGASLEASSNVSLVGKPPSMAPTSNFTPTQNWFGQPQPAKNRKSSTSSPVDADTIKAAKAFISFIDKEIDNNPWVIPTRVQDIFLTTVNALKNKKRGAVVTGRTNPSSAGTQGISSGNNVKVSSADPKLGGESSAVKPAPASKTIVPTTSPTPTASLSTTGPLFGNNTSTSSSLFGQPPTNATSSAPAFSFSSSGTPAGGASPAPIPFAFSKGPPLGDVVQTSEGNNASTEDKNQSSDDVPEDGDTPAVAVLEAQDPDYDTVSQVQKAKLRRRSNGKYQDICTGKLSLQKHKTKGTCRLVFRNVGTGSVLANLSVDKTSGFEPIVYDADGKKPRGHIAFLSCVDTSKGPEPLFLVTKYELLKDTHKKLIALTEA